MLSLTDNIGIIIQCRDKSDRMYHKSVRPFINGESILELILYKLRGIRPIVVATTKGSLETLVLCVMSDVDIYIGSENNVAVRLLEAAKVNGFDGFFRVCADNPFIQIPFMLDYLPYIHQKNPEYDYVAYKKCMLRHEGFFTEFIRTSALQDAVLNMKTIYDKQHVTPFIIRNKKYRKKFLDIPKEMNMLQTRFTVDTISDFRLAKKIYEDMGDEYWIYLFGYVRKNPKIQKEMFKNIVENKK